MQQIFISHINTAAITQTCVAMMTKTVVTDVVVESAHVPSLVGNIYLGVVERVLPSLNSAFVNIGRTRTALLPLKTMPFDIHQGKKVIVQVIKDELGDKGAVLSLDIKLVGRYLVYAPCAKNHVGVSSRITNSKRRKYLIQYIKQMNVTGALKIRTHAMNADDKQLKLQCQHLQTLWRDITQSAQTANGQKKSKPILLYTEPSLALRSLQEYVSDQTQAIWISSQELFEHCVAFAKVWLPKMVPIMQQYMDTVPLFERYGIDSVIDAALDSKVGLPSGGYLVIDHTEAMTVIDVNSGAFVGKTSLKPDQNAYLTNLEAATAIAWQIRLRNLSGIIVVDFIDMLNPSHRHDILSQLQSCIETDKVPTKIVHMSKLGLVELTRKRTRPSLSEQLCMRCPMCQGVGSIKTPQTISLQIMQKVAHLMTHHNTTQTVTVIAHLAITQCLRQLMKSIPNLLDKSVVIQDAPSACHTEYKIILG